MKVQYKKYSTTSSYEAICNALWDFDINRSSNVSCVNKLFVFIYFWLCNLVDPVHRIKLSDLFTQLERVCSCWKENVQWKLANICTCSSKIHIGFKRPETLIHVNYFNESFMSLLKLECFSPVHCNFMEIRHHMLSFVFHEGRVNDWIYILGELFHCSLTDLHFFQFYMILQLHITNARCKCCTTKKKKSMNDSDSVHERNDRWNSN